MGQPEQPRSGAAPSPSASDPASYAAPNPLGVVSLIAAIVLVVLSTIRGGLNVLVPLLMAKYNTGYALWGWGSTILLALVALVAIVIGVVALLQRLRRRTAAIVGVTVGVSWLVMMVGGQLLSVVVAALARAMW
ncbi:hypothetical protein Bra3105_06040 [Brachybacterium halotolerans subsp. kimchii]|uniref:hypothetical protein n=1 Tax=Brachybacterium halotolerans TaxID=2795215 RepID=UPI001E34A634|nr:hypothetical protein [Brachybacterium halotolerans]UEJ83872.1 hypothetical protein Bra3105_06040 [Brachybacterium halotolerans subsp. kimchii]